MELCAHVFTFIAIYLFVVRVVRVTASGDLFKKAPRLRRFKSDRDELWPRLFFKKSAAVW